MLEAAADDLELTGGAVRIKGVADKAIPLSDIARGLRGQPGYALPKDLSPGLEATVSWKTPAMTYCNGAHVAEVEVDPLTGGVTLVRYVVVHDCGRMVNPRLVEGQIHGGVAPRHWPGALRVDALRRGRTATHRAIQRLPAAKRDHGPCARNPSHGISDAAQPPGRQGRGEGGTVPAAAAIASAVDDALSPSGCA